MERFLNRDISIIRFNERVLAEAKNTKLPILERLKFLAIVASNMDEFFMVRVGGILRILDAEGTTDQRFSLPPIEQLKIVRQNSLALINDQYKLLNSIILPQLSKKQIKIFPEWTPSDKENDYLNRYFHENILPVITPSIITTESTMPMITALRMCIAVRLKGHTDKFAFIPVPPVLERFIESGENENNFIPVETLIINNIKQLFPGQSIIEAVPFRITRNADLEVQEELSPDLMKGMKDILKQRKFSACVRLEINDKASEKLISIMISAFNISSYEIYRIPGPLQLQDLHTIAALDSFDHLRHEEFKPAASQPIDEPMFAQIKKGDILLHHPYDCYDPILRFIKEASEDASVLAIKQTIYRVTSNSPIINALKYASEKGKQVTALVELKARFDEARNIAQAQSLEEAGAQVIYGIKGLKTHAKICLIIRKEEGRIVRYAHFGTGNYNERTARLYTDVSFLTANEELCKEGSDFFNAICGHSEPLHFAKIASAPLTLKDKLIDLINSEAERRMQGDRRAAITAKMNSLADPDVIEALYRASKAGVKVRLNVRGICCLKPGIKGLSENITVVSIVGRFLEHSRIFHFRQGGKDSVYISSADWMVRNLEKRIELMVPVESDKCKNTLIQLLNDCFKDNSKSHLLSSDGHYVPLCITKKSVSFDIQDALIRNCLSTQRKVSKKKNTLFSQHKKIKQKSKA